MNPGNYSGNAPRWRDAHVRVTLRPRRPIPRRLSRTAAWPLPCAAPEIFNTPPREGVLNNLVQTGCQTTQPNQIGTQKPQKGKQHNPDPLPEPVPHCSLPGCGANARGAPGQVHPDDMRCGRPCPLAQGAVLEVRPLERGVRGSTVGGRVWGRGGGGGRGGGRGGGGGGGGGGLDYSATGQTNGSKDPSCDLRPNRATSDTGRGCRRVGRSPTGGAGRRQVGWRHNRVELPTRDSTFMLLEPDKLLGTRAWSTPRCLPARFFAPTGGRCIAC